MEKHCNRTRKYLRKRITWVQQQELLESKIGKEIKRKEFAAKSFHTAIDGKICLNRKINYMKLSFE